MSTTPRDCPTGTVRCGVAPDSSVLVKIIGVGMTTAILVDVTLVRLVLALARVLPQAATPPAGPSLDRKYAVPGRPQAV